MQDLFDNSFLATISRLSLSISRVPARTMAGQHLSSRAGPSLQFRDFKPYSAGDDLRRVDWNVYSRTRHLFVRRFDQPTAIPVTLLVDSSASMHLEQPSRYATAARLAAAISSAAIAAQNPVHLSIADRTGGSSRATGGGGLMKLLAALASDRSPSTTGISAAVETLLPLLARRASGVLVVISDFFDERGVEAIISALRRYAGRLVCLRIAQPWDAEPPVDEDVELIDCETDARVQISSDVAVKERYRAAYRQYFQTLEQYLSVRGGRIASFDAAADTSSQLQKIFPNGALVL